jgi:hypothetical protein
LRARLARLDANNPATVEMLLDAERRGLVTSQLDPQTGLLLWRALANVRIVNGSIVEA